MARNYGDLIKTRPILEKVGRELSIPSGPLFGKITIRSPRSFIEISVVDPDPQMAANIANQTAQVFIEDFRTRQFTQIAQLQTSLSQYGITEDPSIIAAQTATLSTLSIVESAVPASVSFSPRTKLNMFLGALIGLVVVGVAIFAVEYLDFSIKGPEELKFITNMPVLGSVMRHRGNDGRELVDLSPDAQGHNPLAESYKFLQTNLRFASLDVNGEETLNTLLVTSSSPAEGKTTTAANLSISVAKEGNSVILVDADLRKPALHRVFGLNDRKGLTHLLMGTATLDEVMAETEIGGLHVIPSGPLPPDATYILRSAKMKEVIASLRSRVGLVVFDSPPLLSVTDPMVLAPLVDGTLLLVDAHHTGRDTVKRGAEMLRQANQVVLGTVLNKISPKGGGYYYYYYRQYHNYYSDGDHKSDGKLGPLTRLKNQANRRWGRLRKLM